MRVKAIIAYDGSHYLGFQQQVSTHRTIMYALTHALESLHIFSEIVGSGRTDAKVHASGQVIHFDIPPYWKDLHRLRQNLNRKLHDIAIKHITPVNDDFHARFSAKQRIYRYVFKVTQPSVFEQNYISCYPSFDIEKLHEALKCFEGKHDFNYFRKVGSHTHHTIREIHTATYRYYKGYHFIYFNANGFLRAQVRMMVHASMLYATDRISLTMIKEQLACQYRHITKPAPPEGLYLAKILYRKEKE